MITVTLGEVFIYLNKNGVESYSYISKEDGSIDSFESTELSNNKLLLLPFEEDLIPQGINPVREYCYERGIEIIEDRPLNFFKAHGLDLDYKAFKQDLRLKELKRWLEDNDFAVIDDNYC